MIFQENIELNINQEYNYRGSGLGLSICKTLSESLCHKIEFISKYGKGSTFRIFLEINDKKADFFSLVNVENTKIDINTNNSIKPNIKNNVNNISSENQDLSKDMLEYSNLTTLNNNFYPVKDNFGKDIYGGDQEMIMEKYKQTNYSLSFKNSYPNDNGFGIVVIDDHKMIRYNSINLIKSVLDSLNLENYYILEGSDGIDLLYYVKEDKLNKIKYIFCDENMEYLNGSDAIKIIRMLEENKKIKKYNITSITAFEDKESRKRILNSGVDQIMSKPCSKSEMVRLMSIENML